MHWCLSRYGQFVKSCFFLTIKRLFQKLKKVFAVYNSLFNFLEFLQHRFSAVLHSVSECGRTTAIKETVFTTDLQKHPVTVRKYFLLFEIPKLPPRASLSREVRLWGDTSNPFQEFGLFQTIENLQCRVGYLYIGKLLQKDVSSPMTLLFHNGTTKAYAANKRLTR